MPRPSLAVTVARSVTALDKLNNDLSGISVLPFKYQWLIAELTMLRTFDILVEGTAELAYKLCAGACYLNGSFPVLGANARSISSARSLLETHGRNKASSLSWTTVSSISKSVKYVLPNTEPYLRKLQPHSNVISDMRKVRNMIAHRNSKARKDYLGVVRQAHGAHLNITPAAFLISTKRSSTTKLHTYIVSSKVILKDIASG